MQILLKVAARWLVTGASCAHMLAGPQRARSHLSSVQVRKGQDLRYVSREDQEFKLEKHGNRWVLPKRK